MNLLLLTTEDLIDHQTARLTDQRFLYIKNIHRAIVGTKLRAGLINGETGSGIVIHIDNKEVRLRINLNTPALPPIPLTLVLALPRPKMLNRILQTIAAMGVSHLILINSARVDKSYWSSPILRTSNIKQQLIAGLEQAGSTLIPQVSLKKLFKPFVEDELPSICANSRCLIAHPYKSSPCPAPQMCATTLAVGPEGGFIPYEVEKFIEQGFTPINIGKRILKVETAIPVLIAKLFTI